MLRESLYAAGSEGIFGVPPSVSLAIAVTWPLGGELASDITKLMFGAGFSPSKPLILNAYVYPAVFHLDSDTINSDLVSHGPMTLFVGAAVRTSLLNMYACPFGDVKEKEEKLNDYLEIRRSFSFLKFLSNR